MNDYILVFDKDGVITDTENFKLLTLENILSQKFPTFSEAIKTFNRNHRGMYRTEKITRIFAEVLDKSLTSTMMDKLLANFENQMQQYLSKIELIPGVREYIIRSKNKKIISSAAPKYEVDIHLKYFGLLNYFEEIYASPNYTDKSKALNAIKHKYKKPIIFFGDALSDYNYAKASAVTFVGVTHCSDAFDNIQGVSLIEDFRNMASKLEAL
ncbi:MAG: HAD hydrolase-like protein [Bacteroidota bacterium]